MNYCAMNVSDCESGEAGYRPCNRPASGKVYGRWYCEGHLGFMEQDRAWRIEHGLPAPEPLQIFGEEGL